MCSIAEYFLNFVWILTRPAGSSILSNKTDQNVQQDICMHEVIKLLVGHSLHLLFLE